MVILLVFSKQVDCSFRALATVTGNILGWASIWRPVLRQFSRPGIFASNEVVIKNLRKRRNSSFLVSIGRYSNYFFNDFVKKSCEKALCNSSTHRYSEA